MKAETCPACGGRLGWVKAKLVCERCRRIAEGCCEGAPQGRQGS